MLSVSSWRTTRQRPAPIARRMAISRRLTVALARNRLATLPTAMSHTSADAQSASVAILRTCGRWFSCLASSSATTSILGGGRGFPRSMIGVMPAAIAVNCAEATSAVTSAFSRPALGDRLVHAAGHSFPRPGFCAHHDDARRRAASGLNQFGSSPSWPCIMSGAQKSVSFAKIVPVNDRRKDADDGERIPVQRRDAAERPRVGIEVRSPQPVADDDHWMSVRRAVVVWREDPSTGRADAEHVEVNPARDLPSGHAGVLFRPCALSGIADWDRHVLDRGQRNERGVVVAQRRVELVGMLRESVLDISPP